MARPTELSGSVSSHPHRAQTWGSKPGRQVSLPRSEPSTTLRHVRKNGLPSDYILTILFNQLRTTSWGVGHDLK